MDRWHAVTNEHANVTNGDNAAMLVISDAMLITNDNDKNLSSVKSRMEHWSNGW